MSGRSRARRATLPREQNARDPLDAVIVRLADRVGELVDFWGFSPHTGRVWTLLYLTEEPLSAAEIGRRLAMSSGLVSQTVAELLRWGVIYRLRHPAHKGWLYAEDPDVWRSVTRVLREREHRMITDTIALMDTLLEVVREQQRKANPAAPRARHVRARLEALRRLARAGQFLLDALLAASRLDVAPLREVMRLANVRRKLPFAR